MGTIYKGTVLAETVALRTGPGSNYSLSDKKASLTKGTVCFIKDTFLENKKLWGKTQDGWICLINKGDRYVDYAPYQLPVRNRASQHTVDSSVVTYDAQSGTETTVDATDATTSSPIGATELTNIFQFLTEGTDGSGHLFKKTMRLFGLPFQFREAIDPRVSKVSPDLGRKFLENIVNEAPVVTIIPGKPVYLPGVKNKEGWTHAFVSAATGNFSGIQQLAGEADTVRYYDFQQDYTEYMSYVNIMCRSAATFLELTDTIDGTSLQKYDWRNWRWSGSNYKSVASNMLTVSAGILTGTMKKLAQGASGLFSKVTSYFSGDTSDSNSAGSGKHAMKYNTTDGGMEDESFSDLIEAAFSTANFVQFYCDPDMGTSESASNSSTTSSIQGAFDSGSSAMKELSFMANSGALESVGDLQNFTDTSLQALADHISSGGQITTFLSRLLSVSTNVVKGENVIMPEIYSSSSYDRRYSLRVHLKAPYGNKYCYFMEILVPLFHLMALVLPKQTSANTYGAPFLVKAYCEGIFSCNLGMVSSISVNKNVSPESWTTDGFPSEVDVEMEIVDLYSDLTMSPQKSPMMFLSNSSLIEYLATSCGLNLIQPQIDTKLRYTINTIKNAFGDVDQNLAAEVSNKVENLMKPWIDLTRL